MKKLACFVILFIPGFVTAQSVFLTDQTGPYEIVPVEAAPEVQTSFLGELTGFPIMYELSTDRPFVLQASVRQLANKKNESFSLIVIRQNDRGGGVTEVGRMNISPDAWPRARDGVAGLSFAESPSITTEVDAGIYRIEVSTPENAGKYQLLVGEQEVVQPYFDRLVDTRLIQQFFGYGPIAMIGSRLVYMPIFVLLLLYVVYRIARSYMRIQATARE